MKLSTRQQPISHDQSLETVYFEYIDPNAQSVAIAGTFNDWRPQVTPMVNMGHGCWRKLLSVAPGTYEYTFVVDGRWLERDGTSGVTRKRRLAAVESATGNGATGYPCRGARRR